MTDNVYLTAGDAYQLKAVKWIIPGWLARSECHIIAGAAKCGKSTLVTHLAAEITKGGRFFDEQPVAARRVAYYTTEDDLQSALLPRFKLAGGDLSKVHVANPLTDAAKELESLPNMLSSIRKELGLVVIDGVMSAINNAVDLTEVRAYLNKAKRVAQSLDVPVLFITHTPKGAATKYTDPVDYVTGCAAWVQVPRIVWMLMRDKSVDEPCALLTRYGNLPGMGEGGIRIYPGPDESVGKDANGDEIIAAKLDIDRTELLDGRTTDLFELAVGLKKDAKPPKNARRIEESKEAAFQYLRKNEGIVWHKWGDIVSECLGEYSRGCIKSAKDELASEKIVEVKCGLYGSAKNTHWVRLLSKGADYCDASWQSNVADINV